MTQQEYDMYTNLFDMDGWKKVMADLEDLRQAALEAAPHNAISNESWQFLRGQIQQMDNFLGYQLYIDASWKQQNDPGVAEEDEYDSEAI